MPLPFQSQSELGTTSLGAKGFQTQLSPELQALFQQFTGAGQGFTGALGSFDPNQSAQDMFQRREDILNPLREQQRQSQDARLLRQGRLGSTGGGIQQEDLQGAFANQRSMDLNSAFQQSQQAQQHLLNMGLGATGGAFDISQGLQGQAQLGGNLSMQQAQLQAQEDARRKKGGFLSSLGGAFLPAAATAFGTPLGGMAANWAQGLFQGGAPDVTGGLNTQSAFNNFFGDQ